ncbi:MAG: hypothetical protein KKE39_12545 [Bacteroidetes bacterium]|nr:hypothetical protein [Bacteroidota bacterium]MBU1371646.1 hypothetical protein [Bacteroidota bacterium]MBU1486222.1 hypothetical protein [Bacteroidota bacterium]MBU1759654.1 hypothetical protein [Bacteroidota bacterium]MBU2267491.1 hypothetical protein [Bacteroidota bacterium]
MNKIYPFILFLILSYPAFCQLNYGPRIASLANAGVALQDVWCAQNNQAGLAKIERPQISIAYESRFGVKELSTKSAVFALPFKSYVISASFTSYGVESYAETKTGLSLAKKFGDNLHLAVNANYHQINITNYGNENTFSVEAGIQYKVTPSLWLASHIANPNQSKYGKNIDQIIPPHIRFGASYIISKQLMLCSEIEKVLDGNTDFKTGIEYKVVDFLALRGGISVNTFKQYAGFGLNYQKIAFDFAVSSHPVLGYSPQISLGYEF